MTLKDQSILEIIYDIDENSCPNKVNLHCHTTFSDGSLEPLELIKQATSLKLDSIAITDHHSVSSYNIIKKWINQNKESKKIPNFISGIEISCLLNGCLVHILGLDINTTSNLLIPYIQGEAPSGFYLEAKKVINIIRESNGISILAHPARYRKHYKELIKSAYNNGIDGIEVWYDYDYNNIWEPSSILCNSIEEIANQYDLLKTCGTDTHGYSLLSR